jgi:type I restriction enzyme S subunit
MWWLTFVASNGVVKEKLIFNPLDFLKFHISLPTDLEEQRAIVDILDTCDEELRLLRAQREAIDLQKRGLMERLLTGDLRVQP